MKDDNIMEKINRLNYQNVTDLDYNVIKVIELIVAVFNVNKTIVIGILDGYGNILMGEISTEIPIKIENVEHFHT